MFRIARLTVLCLAAGATLGACKPDEVIESPTVPTAGVRFINAVPDSAGAFGLDFRFIDLVENSAHFRIGFRNNPTASGGVTASTQIQFKPARAGNRQYVVFLNDSLQQFAQIRLKEGTMNLEAGKNYTVLLWGNARAGSTPALELKVIEETVPDPGASVALRVINTTGAPIDVRHYVSGGTAPATATWANVAPGGVSNYVTTAPGQIRYNVQPAGGGANLFADALAMVGAQASSTAGAAGKYDIPPLPGTTVAGSAVTLVVFPRSVAGARTPQTSAFQVPGGSFMWDRRPPACPNDNRGCTYSSN